MNNKKILLVGECAQGSILYSYERTFRALNYDVIVFDTKKNYVPISKMPSRLKHFFSLLNNVVINFFFKRRAQSMKPDIIFFIKAETISYKTIAFIRKNLKSILINFYPDNPFVFWNGNSNAHILRSLPLYDYFLIWSKMLIPVLESAGAQKVLYMPFAYDESIFSKKVVITEQDRINYSSDVCFVGTWDAEREWWLTQLCNQMPNLDMAIWGNDWNERLDNHSILRKKVRGDARYNDDMIKIFRSSKIVLNFIRKQNMTSHNMRTFEVPAAQGFLLTQWSQEQACDLFQENDSIACFKSIDELVEKIHFFLTYEDKRFVLIQKGYEQAQYFKLESVLKCFLHDVHKELSK